MNTKRLMRLRKYFIGFLLGPASMLAADPSGSVTFNKDVLPVLQKNCQSCHRPGEVAPMSLLTYNDARPWAKAIKTGLLVLTQKMPHLVCGSQIRSFCER